MLVARQKFEFVMCLALGLSACSSAALAQAASANRAAPAQDRPALDRPMAGAQGLSPRPAVNADGAARFESAASPSSDPFLASGQQKRKDQDCRLRRYPEKRFEVGDQAKPATRCDRPDRD
jgi:hypothetical protein